MGRSLIFFASPTRKPQTSSHSWDRCSCGLVMPHSQSASCLTSIVTQHFSWGSGVSQAVTLLSWSLWIRDEVLRKKSRNSPWTSCNIYLSFLEISFCYILRTWKWFVGKPWKVFFVKSGCHLEGEELDSVDRPVHVVHHPLVQLHEVLRWDDVVRVQVKDVVEKISELVSLKVSQQFWKSTDELNVTEEHRPMLHL